MIRCAREGIPSPIDPSHHRPCATGGEMLDAIDAPWAPGYVLSHERHQLEYGVAPRKRRSSGMRRRTAKDLVPLDASCTVSVEELRRRVLAWPQEKLAGLVLECVERDAELLASVEREIVRERGAGPAAVRLRADIDRVIEVDFVDERHVAAFCARLDGVLGSIVSLGATDPATALPVAWHFVEAIPSVLDSVQCEDEMGIFCDNLGKAAISLAAKSPPHLRETLTRLLDAYLKDGHGVFNDVPRLVSAARLANDDRVWLIGVVIGLRPAAKHWQAIGLDELLGRLRKGRYGSRLPRTRR